MSGPRELCPLCNRYGWVIPNRAANKKYELHRCRYCRCYETVEQNSDGTIHKVLVSPTPEVKTPRSRENIPGIDAHVNSDGNLKDIHINFCELIEYVQGLLDEITRQDVTIINLRKELEKRKKDEKAD